MAISYANLFAAIGEYIQRTNDYVALYADIDTDFSEIKSDLQSGNFSDVLEGELTRFDTMKTQLLGWIGQNTLKTAALLTHRVNVLQELNLPVGTDFNSVMQALIWDMLTTSNSVDASTVTNGAVTATKNNTNAGVVVLGKGLDGVSSPMSGYQASRHYWGVDSELAAATDDMFCICMTDKDNGGSADSERFQIGGGPVQSFGRFSWETYGSGNGPSIYPVQSQSIISNFSFDTFTVTDTPDDWTVDSGTVTTHIKNSADVYKSGGAALQFLGDGAQATIQVSQTPTWTAGRRYCVAVYVKGEAGIAAGTLTIQLEGTGYTAGASEKITMNASALAAATSYGLQYFFVNIPMEIPSDLKLVIKVTGTLTNAKSVRFDFGGMAPVVYHNGIHVSVISGSEYFVLGDKFTWTTTNDEAGIVQTYFGKAHKFQLPSNAAGAETILDTVAT